MDIRQIIRDRINNLGVKQADVAAMANLKPSRLSRYLSKGKTHSNLNADALDNLIDVLGGYGINWGSWHDRETERRDKRLTKAISAQRVPHYWPEE
jgi:transcriptional regulator with XRE-family HTH domain